MSDWMDAVRRRQRHPNADPTQLRLDIDRLLGEVDRRGEIIRALMACLLEQGQVAEEAGLVLQGVYRNTTGVANDPSLNGFRPPTRLGDRAEGLADDRGVGR
jgi:hypothetical protein